MQAGFSGRKKGRRAGLNEEKRDPEKKKETKDKAAGTAQAEAAFPE